MSNNPEKASASIKRKIQTLSTETPLFLKKSNDAQMKGDHYVICELEKNKI